MYIVYAWKGEVVCSWFDARRSRVWWNYTEKRRCTHNFQCIRFAVGSAKSRTVCRCRCRQEISFLSFSFLFWILLFGYVACEKSSVNSVEKKNNSTRLKWNGKNCAGMTFVNALTVLYAARPRSALLSTLEPFFFSLSLSLFSLAVLLTSMIFHMFGCTYFGCVRSFSVQRWYTSDHQLKTNNVISNE